MFLPAKYKTTDINIYIYTHTMQVPLTWAHCTWNRSKIKEDMSTLSFFSIQSDRWRKVRLGIWYLHIPCLIKVPDERTRLHVETRNIMAARPKGNYDSLVLFWHWELCWALAFCLPTIGWECCTEGWGSVTETCQRHQVSYDSSASALLSMFGLVVLTITFLKHGVPSTLSFVSV